MGLEKLGNKAEPSHDVIDFTNLLVWRIGGDFKR